MDSGLFGEGKGEWALHVILVIVSCVAIVANLLVILIFMKKPGLRTVSNRFVINLLITNLISSAVLIPLLLADDLTKSYYSIRPTNESSHVKSFPSNLLLNPIEKSEISFKQDVLNFEFQIKTNEELILHDQTTKIYEKINTKTQFTNHLNSTNALCYLAEGSASLVCAASILSIFLISIDQYFAVVHPLRYHMRIDQFKSIIWIATSWVVSIFFGILGSVTQDKNASLWNFCSYNNVDFDSAITVRIVYAVIYFILIILTPFIAICVIYACIYTAAHKNSERMRHTNSGSITINIETYVPVPITEDEGGLMLHIEETFNQRHSIEVLNEIPIKIEDWDSTSLNESKKCKSVPNLDGVDSIDKPVHLLVPSVQKFADSECSDSLDSFEKQEVEDSPRKLSICIDSCRRKSTTESAKSVSIIGTPKPRTGSLKSTSSFMNTLKCRISNASMFKYREETRAAKISVFVIVMVFICYVPYGVALILHSVLSSPIINLSIFDRVAIVHLIFSSVISPFLFAYRSKRIKRELRKLFYFKKKDVDLHRKSVIRRNSSFKSLKENNNSSVQQNVNSLVPFIDEVEKVHGEDGGSKSILKRVCSKTKWNNVKKTCNFMTVPDSCLGGDSRSSFSSQNSTQTSNISDDR